MLETSSFCRRGHPDFLDGVGAGKIAAMGVKLTPIPQMPDREPTDHETLLLQLLRELSGVHSAVN